MVLITLDKFVEEVRVEFCILGFPPNRQPVRNSIAQFYYWRYTIAECVRFHRSDVKRYEREVAM